MVPDVGNMNIYDTGRSRSGRFWTFLTSTREQFFGDGYGVFVGNIKLLKATKIIAIWALLRQLENMYIYKNIWLPLF